MNMNKYIFIGLTGIIFSSITGCLKDDINIDSERLVKFDRPINFAGPIATVKFKASDLIGRMGDNLKSYIYIDEDGLLNAKYSDSINVFWDDIVKLEDVQFKNDYPIIIPPGYTSMSESVTFIEKIKLNERNNQRFDSMILQSALLLLDIDFPNDLTGQLKLAFPELSKGGEILEINYDSQNAQSWSESDLSGYFINFGQGADSSYITMEITPENITANDALGGSYNLGIDLSLNETVPEITFGSFGSSNVLDEDESLPFGLFRDLKAFDMIEFFDIHLLIDFESYYGVSYECLIDEAMVISNYKEDSVKLVFEGDNSLFVEAATYNNEIIPILKSKEYNHANSNIRDAIHIFPDVVDYHVQVNTNPDNADALNFVIQQNKISGALNVVIPLWLKCENYKRTDTIHSFDVNEMFNDETLEYLNSVSLSFGIKNMLPFDLNLQAYLADSNNVVVDSLFNESQQFLVSGKLDENDMITEEGVSEQIDIIMTKEEIEFYQTKGVKKILLASKTITSGEGERFVKIMEDYGMEFKLTLEIISDEIQ
jgi:hypothetical protein